MIASRLFRLTSGAPLARDCFAVFRLTSGAALARDCFAVFGLTSGAPLARGFGCLSLGTGGSATTCWQTTPARAPHADTKPEPLRCARVPRSAAPYIARYASLFRDLLGGLIPLPPLRTSLRSCLSPPRSRRDHRQPGLGCLGGRYKTRAPPAPRQEPDRRALRSGATSRLAVLYTRS